MNRADASSKGATLMLLLTLIFILLKATGRITWSWLWVLCPLWFGFAVYAFVLVVIFIAATVVFVVREIKSDDVDNVDDV